MTNAEIKKAWAQLDGDKMYQMIEKACREVIKQRPNMARAACVCAAELAGEAWIRIDRKIESGAESVSVEKLVIIAATESLTAAARFNAHSVGGSVDDGGELDTAQADSLSEKLQAREDISSGIKRPVENAVINQMGLNAAAMDKRDQRIIDGLKHGLTKREIAAREGISAPAISQRLDKIAERLRVGIDEEIDALELDRMNAAEAARRNQAAKTAAAAKAANMQPAKK